MRHGTCSCYGRLRQPLSGSPLALGRNQGQSFCPGPPYQFIRRQTVCQTEAHTLGGEAVYCSSGDPGRGNPLELRTSSRPIRMSGTDRWRSVGSRAMIRLRLGQDWPAVRPVTAKTALGWEA